MIKKYFFLIGLIFTIEAHAQVGDFLRGLADKVDKYSKQDNILPNKNISLAKKSLEETLYDPESVRYKNIKETKFGVVCGEYNAKNRHGGYVGFSPFIFFTRDITVLVQEKEESRHVWKLQMYATMNTSGLDYNVTTDSSEFKFPYSYKIFKNQVYTTGNMKYDDLPSDYENILYKKVCVWNT